MEQIFHDCFILTNWKILHPFKRNLCLNTIPFFSYTEKRVAISLIIFVSSKISFSSNARSVPSVNILVFNSMNEIRLKTSVVHLFLFTIMVSGIQISFKTATLGCSLRLFVNAEKNECVIFVMHNLSVHASYTCKFSFSTVIVL